MNQPLNISPSSVSARTGSSSPPTAMPVPSAWLGWWVVQQQRWWNVLGRTDRVVALYAQALDRYPHHSEWVEALAYALAQSGQRAAAIDVLHAHLTRYPGSANAWFNLGFLLQEERDHPVQAHQSAEACLRRATQLDDRHDRAWYGLALECIQHGDLAGALPCLKRCTVLQPMSPYAWYQMARVHADLGQPDEAQRVLNHLQTFEPKVAGQLRRELSALTPTPA